MLGVALHPYYRAPNIDYNVAILKVKPIDNYGEVSKLSKKEPAAGETLRTTSWETNEVGRLPCCFTTFLKIVFWENWKLTLILIVIFILSLSEGVVKTIFTTIFFREKNSKLRNRLLSLGKLARLTWPKTSPLQESWCASTQKIPSCLTLTEVQWLPKTPPTFLVFQCLEMLKIYRIL